MRTIISVVIDSSLRRRLRVHLSAHATTSLLFALLGCSKEADYEKQYKWGFRNIQNEVVIDPQYDSVKPFFQGLAAVYSEGKGWGYIDKAGATIIPMQYDDAGIFNKDGLAVVKPRGELEKKYREEEVHYTNRSGNTVLSVKGDRAWSFHDGVAWVRKYIGTKSSSGHKGSMLSSTDYYSWGLIDRSGDYLVPHVEPERIEDLDKKKNIWSVDAWSEGLSVIRRDKAGYMNTAGEIVIPCRYEYAYPFSDGRAFVKSGNGVWSVIDKKGRTLFSQLPGGVNFKPKGRFSYSLAPVTWTRDNTNYIAYISTRGKFAFSIKGMRLHSISGYAQGIAQVGVQTDGRLDKIGFIDLKGNWAVDPAFIDAGHFHVVDRTGRNKDTKSVTWAIPWFEYNFWDAMSDLGLGILGMHEKTSKRKFGYIDSTGDWIIQPETTMVHNFRRNKDQTMSAVHHGLYDFSEGLVAFPSIAP